MKVSELGEFGVVELLARMVAESRDNQSPAWQRLVLGMGDDCAAWRGDGSVQLAHVDSVIEGVHFTLDTTPWDELGWKSLAVTLSDIAAMGGIPTYALVSLTLTEAAEVEDVAAMYRGMLHLAKRFGVAIIGGDTSYAPIVSVTVTAMGNTGKRSAKQLLTRSAARPGDRIAVTGYPGAAAAGLKVLTDRMKIGPKAAGYLKRAFLHPLPRIAEGRLLLQHGVRAAIDISDGLVSDLRHVCELSRAGARIEAERLPIHPFVRENFGDEAVELALSGGEDYELLFTAGETIIQAVQKAVECPVTVIGEITPDNAGRVTVVDRAGREMEVGSAGWEHFKTK